MTPDGELLRRYAETQSEDAFSELVQRHLDLVYSAALRQVNGDSHLAKDVAQTVFTDLARKAVSLSNRPVLTGWLYTSAHFAAAKVVRTERRRHAREEEAQLMHELLSDPAPDLDWETLQPVLDAAMLELDEPEREAVLLRYFENRPHGEIASRFGLSENAARMRVARALDKLQGLLKRHGVTTSVAALSAILSANSIQAAPLGLAAAISTTAAVSVTTFAITTTQAILMTTLQKSFIAVLVIAGVATPLFIHHQSTVKRSAAENALRLQTDELARQQAENGRLASLAAQTGRSDGTDELSKLRAQAEELRKQTNALPKLRAENRRLQAAANTPEVEPSPAEKQDVAARMADNKKWLMASYMYARKNQGQFPSAITQVAAASPDSRADQVEIVYQGSLKSMAKPQELIVFRQKEAIPYGNKWAKLYGYGDGHVEMRTQTERDFNEWEKQHIPAAVAP